MLQLSITGKVDPPRAAQPLYDALAEAQSSLPDVQHSKLSHANHAAYSIPTHTLDTTNDSIAMNTSNDHTSQTIQDIDNLLNSSAVSSLSNSTYSTQHGHNNSDHVSNRRRTMAHVPWTQVQPTEYTHTNNNYTDEGASDAATVNTSVNYNTTANTHSATMNEPLAPAVQYAPFTHPNNGYSDTDRTYSTNFPTTSQSNNDSTNYQSRNVNNVTQRRRPRSLPETRTDLYSTVPPAYLTAPTTIDKPVVNNVHHVPLGDSNDYLADVPRPVYAANPPSVDNEYNKSLVEESCVASRIDEELECVTSNIDMLL